MSNLVVSRAPVELGAQALADNYRQVVAEHRTVLAQGCDQCEAHFFPPLLGCSKCQYNKLSWIECGTSGIVGTFVTVHARTVTPSMGIPKWLRDRTPYSSVYVVPDSVPSIRIPALMEGPQQDRLAVGARVDFDLSDPRTLQVHLSSA